MALATWRSVPSCQNYVSICMGSKLAATMREIDQLDDAQDELARADSEEEPPELCHYDVGMLIRDTESNSRHRRVVIEEAII